MKKKLKKVPKHAVLIFLLFFMLYPIFMVTSNSFKTEAQLYQDPLGFPKEVNTENYTEAIEDGKLGTAFISSVIITTSAVLFVTFCGSLAAFALTRAKMKFRKVYYWLFITGLMIPFQVGLLHLYRIVDKIGLLDTYVGLTLIYTAYGLPFVVFLMYGFFSAIPKEIEEAALIDGCNNWKLYSKIIMPLSASVIAAVIICNLVWVWNDMLYPLIFIDTPDKQPLAKALLGFKGQFVSRYTVMFAGVVLASIPLVITYVLMQKRFIKGMMTGSVKG